MSEKKPILELTKEVLELGTRASLTGDENIMNKYREKSKELKSRLKEESEK